MTDPRLIEAMHAAIDSGWAFIAYGVTIEAVDGEPILEDHGDGTATFRGRIRPVDRANSIVTNCWFVDPL